MNDLDRAIMLVERLHSSDLEKFMRWFTEWRPRIELADPSDYAAEVSNRDIADALTTQAGAPELRQLVATGVAVARRRPVRAKEKRSLALTRDWLATATMSRADGSRVSYLNAKAEDWEWRLAQLHAQARGVASSIMWVSQVLTALAQSGAETLGHLTARQLRDFELAGDEPKELSA